MEDKIQKKIVDTIADSLKKTKITDDMIITEFENIYNECYIDIDFEHISYRILCVKTYADSEYKEGE